MHTPNTTVDELERLRIANQNKADIISISIHELRTSLSALKWLLKMLEDEDLGHINAEQRSLINRASTSIERMGAIVSDVLTLSHTDDSLIKYVFEPFDLVHLVDEVLFDFTGEAHNRGVEVLFVKPDAPVTIRGDSQKLRVAVQNLIENAIKYCERNDRVSIFINVAKDGITLSVKDTGIGIPTDEQDKIFDKFYRASNAVKKEMVGSGLGLYTTKSIVERHGGRVTYESQPGKGTTFTITLPPEPSNIGASLAG